MDNIHDPITGKQYYIFSIEGKRILKQYIKQFQSGGMVIKLNKNMFSKNAHDFGHDTCVINTLNWIGMPKHLVLELVNAYKDIRKIYPDTSGICPDVYLRILNKWVDELVTPENPEHKRLVPGRIEPFEFRFVDIEESMTTYEYIPALVNRVFSYIKPMTSRVLQIIWKDGTCHLTCAGRDGNNIPFLVELQNDYPEAHNEDCKHIPYDWIDVLEYFSTAKEVSILMGGPTLRPVGDIHKFMSIDDIPDGKVSNVVYTEGEGGGGELPPPPNTHILYNCFFLLF